MKIESKTRVFAMISVLIGLLISVVLLEVMLQLLPVNTGLRVEPVSAAQPVLCFEPNRQYVFSRGWDFSVVNKGRVNNFGFVNDQDYEPTAKTPLLAVIGDSFIEALMVPFAETVQGRLASAAGGAGRVYSFAASGSPLSQYMAYAKYVRDEFHPNALVVSIIGNDFDESLLKYKAEPSFHYFAETESGELELTRVDYQPSRVRRLMRYSALARYAATNMYLLGPVTRTIQEGRNAPAQEYVGNVVARTDPIRILDSERAVSAFLDQLPRYSGLPVGRILFLIDGIRPNLYTEEGLRAAEGSYFDHMRNFFISQAVARGYQIADLQVHFVERHRRDGSVFEFPTDGHWSGTGHGVAADAVMESALFRNMFDHSR